MVARAGKPDSTGEGLLDRGHCRSVMWSILREGVRPPADSDSDWLGIELKMKAQLVENVGKQIVVGKVQCRQTVAAK